MTTNNTMSTPITYRVFYIGCEGKTKGTWRSCIRIFKEHQEQEAKTWAKRYCVGSESGAILEVIMYADHKAVKRVLAVRHK